jgi:hypothetical protein
MVFDLFFLAGGGGGGGILGCVRRMSKWIIFYSTVRL